MLWKLFGKYSQLSLTNKLLGYKRVLRQIWTCGLWGSARPSNVNRLQMCQSRIHRLIVNAPFYVSNHTLHNDQKIQFVADLPRFRYPTFHASLYSRLNPSPLLFHHPTEPTKAPKKEMVPGPTVVK